MPLIILGAIVVVAVILIFYYINTGVRRVQNEEDESEGKVIALFDVIDVEDEEKDPTQPEEEE